MMVALPPGAIIEFIAIEHCDPIMTKQKTPEQGGICSHKFAFLLDNWIRRLIQNLAKIIGEYIQPGDIAIDMGCGPGFFTIEMARLVGEEGQAIAVDMQPEMLARVARKAARKGVAAQVTCHRCEPDRIGLDLAADFMLAYYMVHETPDAAAFFREARTLLRGDGHLLVVEPKMHVTRRVFDQMLAVAEEGGFKVISFPLKKGGHSVLLGIAEAHPLRRAESNRE